MDGLVRMKIRCTIDGMGLMYVGSFSVLINGPSICIPALFFNSKKLLSTVVILKVVF